MRKKIIHTSNEFRVSSPEERMAAHKAKSRLRTEGLNNDAQFSTTCFAVIDQIVLLIAYFVNDRADSDQYEHAG